jgi:hypothetical protein
MSEFTLHDGEDLIDYIKTPEDLEKFKRMKWLEQNEFNKPAKECIQAVIEYDHLYSDLKGLPRRKFLILGDPKLN